MCSLMVRKTKEKKSKKLKCDDKFLDEIERGVAALHFEKYTPVKKLNEQTRMKPKPVMDLDYLINLLEQKK